MNRLFSFIFFLFSYFVCSNNIVAVVGSDIILKSDLEEMFFLQQKQNPTITRPTVLDGMIEQKVLVYFARQDTTLIVDDIQLNQMVKEQLDTYKQQFGGSVENLEKYFDKSFSQVFDYLYKQGEDIFLANQLKQKLFSRVSVSSAEIASFYEKEKDNMPLTPPLYSYYCFNKKITPSSDRVLKTKELADSVLVEIKKNGADFSSFYSSFSGGDVEFKRGDFGLPEFEWAAFSLKSPGDIAGPVLTALGYHLIELVDRLGEKAKVNHILFPLSLNKDDEKEHLSFVEKELSLSVNDPIYLDMLCREASKEEGGFSGFFSGAPQEVIPSKVFDVIKPLSQGSFSEIVKTSDSFFFVYLSQKQNPSTPTLRENWEQIEWMALQYKFNSFFIDWYNKNSSKVYIKKYSLN
tara:strand:+ start:12061 stop:13278 length:1218 start_codon:yes stop_codon:yes gene_type:complete